jgi:hypothetical protein
LIPAVAATAGTESDVLATPGAVLCSGRVVAADLGGEEGAEFLPTPRTFLAAFRAPRQNLDGDGAAEDEELSCALARCMALVLSSISFSTSRSRSASKVGSASLVESTEAVVVAPGPGGALLLPRFLLPHMLGFLLWEEFLGCCCLPLGSFLF